MAASFTPRKLKQTIFYIEGNLAVTVDIGSHDIYRA
jgi:hypothetical protein